MIDVAINNLPACYPSSAIFLIVQALVFKELNVVVVNGHSKSLCLVKINVDRLFMRGTINEQGGLKL